MVHTALFEAAMRLGVIVPPPANLTAMSLPGTSGQLATVTLESVGGGGGGGGGVGGGGGGGRPVHSDKTVGGSGGGGGGGEGGGGGGETREVRARLVVGADGARSGVRQLAGLRAPGWRYGQKAVVGTVTTADKHNTAWQRFLPRGPLALLPVTVDGSLSNIVWWGPPDITRHITRHQFIQYTRARNARRLRVRQWSQQILLATSQDAV